ncbi:MAG: dimethylarginine dimethylaminohydrolase family protein [Thermovirga sp.]
MKDTAGFRNSSQYYHAVLQRIQPKATPAFEAEEMQERVWGKRWGVFNDVGRIRMIALHRPGDEVRIMTSEKYDPSIDALIDDREQWYFRSEKGPDLTRMQQEHDRLVSVLSGNGIEIVHVGCGPRNPNAMFVRDDAIIVRGGAVISRMGPVGEAFGTGRRGEEAYITRSLVEIGMPILHTIHGEGLLEGGSFSLLDETHAVVGVSPRQNAAGVDQLRCVLRHQGIELIEVPLTGYSMHIDGALMMVDHDKVLVNVERLPYWFLEKLGELGIEGIPVDYRDDALAAINSLTIAPGKVLVDSTATWTGDLLAARGLTVIPVPYEECRKHGGGIHCSTLPLIRERS